MKRWVRLNIKGEATIKNIKPDIAEISHFEVDETDVSTICDVFILLLIKNYFQIFN